MTTKTKLVSSLLSLGIAVAGVSSASAAVNLEDPLYIAKKGEGYTKLFVGANSKDSYDYGYQAKMLRLVGEVGHSFTDRFMLSLKMAFSGNYSEDRKGLHKANLEALYRVVDSKIKFDVIGGISFGGLMKSEADVVVSAPTAFVMFPKNYSYGMYGLVFGARVGGNITDDLTVGALFEGTYRFGQKDGLEADVTGIVNGTAKATFKDLFDMHTQIGASYKVNDKLFVNGKVSYTYYDGKIVKDVSASGTAAALVPALKGKDLKDSWSEYGFGGSVMYSLNESIQIGPYGEYLLGGHMGEGALDVKYRTEYGVKFNARF